MSQILIEEKEELNALRQIVRSRVNKQTKKDDSSKKEVKMVELKNISEMTDAEIDEYAKQIWGSLQEKKN